MREEMRQQREFMEACNAHNQSMYQVSIHNPNSKLLYFNTTSSIFATTVQHPSDTYTCTWRYGTFDNCRFIYTLIYFLIFAFNVLIFANLHRLRPKRVVVGLIP
jgi:hypothetical protein